MPEARLYIGETATEDQRRELEAIFSGKKSGHLESLWGATIDEWLPAKVASIAIAWGEEPTLSVDGFGQATMRPISNGAGKATLEISMSSTGAADRPRGASARQDDSINRTRPELELYRP